MEKRISMFPVLNFETGFGYDCYSIQSRLLFETPIMQLNKTFIKLLC